MLIIGVFRVRVCGGAAGGSSGASRLGRVQPAGSGRRALAMLPHYFFRACATAACSSVRLSAPGSRRPPIT